MPRIWLCLAIAVTSFAVPSLASTSGEETPDKKDVRELIYQIIDADMKGNSERFLSFMAPEVINYDATPEDPELWWVVASIRCVLWPPGPSRPPPPCMPSTRIGTATTRSAMSPPRGTAPWR
jgi:hypothetical protein